MYTVVYLSEHGCSIIDVDTSVWIIGADVGIDGIEWVADAEGSMWTE